MTTQKHAVDLPGMPRAALAAWLRENGVPESHARGLWRSLHVLGETPARALECLPEKHRGRLAPLCETPRPEILRESAGGDGLTRKFLLRLADGARIETVLMRYDGRATACLSTQAGCAMGCVFCATGRLGLRRNLTAGEIVAQALVAREALGGAGERLRNVVLMGMGEPLANYDNVRDAVEILCDSGGLALRRARVSLSTVGIVPGILRMAAEPRPVSLAVSLHAASQEERAALIPAARRWPLDSLLQACREYSRAARRKVFFEWTLIHGRNDTPDSARTLAALLRGLDAHVNLIPLNPVAGFGGRPGGSEAARQFQEILRRAAIPSTLRQYRGLDIAAGCGQLAAGGVHPARREPGFTGAD
ncbi:MAG: 23S rRNA (adenine(2503)-C(2))-methyltransferase RlmN [Puniceicoccales bacterium]|jgi:23S rRNA (adenine2503-C2)-methyltransferase|nr:23S rRNA (adenine(2503)-C(2))-methyltransferase RlmN [Puniceicoccales bacterium]